MIYLPDAGVDRVCVHSRECNKKCKDYPRTCSPPEEAVKQMEDGIWSQNIRNNPFAVYFKVYLPSCSSDEFSGIRGNSSGTEDLFFYGRHIFSSLLRDLVDYFNIANAEDVVLIGSGSGARGAARNCDFLAESIAKVNTAATIRCVLDGVDFVPYWVQSPNCFNDKHQIKEESQKYLWARQDDKSCIEENRGKVNSTELATRCGVFSKFWRHIDTPVFLMTTQLDTEYFSETTCGVSRTRYEDYSDYSKSWRQGVLVMTQAMSVEKPRNGWFIPNCDSVHFFLGAKHAAERRTVRVRLLQEEEQTVNAFQAINNWLTTGGRRHHQAIDPFGVPNERCSATKSLPLDLGPGTFFEAVPSGEPQNDAPRSSGGGRRPPLHRPSQAVKAAAASASLAATAAQGLFLEAGFGRFHPPAEFIGNIDSGDYDIFDYDGLGIDSADDNYDFDLDIATAVRAHPADRHIGNHGSPTPFLTVTAGPIVHRHPHQQRGRPIVHSRNKRIRLWRKLYYLDYLRKLYARHFNDYYNDFYGPGGNLAAIPDHPVALTDARAGTANAQVHLPAATDHVKLATFNDPVQTYHRSRTTFGKIQLKKGKSDPKSVSNDQAYEYPDEQVEEIAVK